MKTVLQQILRLKHRYQTRPFFDFLRDERLTPRQRLAFFPCMAPFILAFGDLNRHVLREEPTSDPHQHLINQHTLEDDHHWPWYLEDLTKLGHDAPRPPSEWLNFMFGEPLAVNRLLMSRLAHLVWEAPPVVRLAIVEAIEETGQVLFTLTAKLAREFQAETGVELRYCGDYHLKLESGHLMAEEHRVLAAIELTPEQQAHALEAAELVFAWFGDWTDELLRFARSDQLVAVEES
jgi:hypothetical protein